MASVWTTWIHFMAFFKATLPTETIRFNHSHTEHPLSDASRRGVKARPLPPVVLSFLPCTSLIFSSLLNIYGSSASRVFLSSVCALSLRTSSVCVLCRRTPCFLGLDLSIALLSRSSFSVSQHFMAFFKAVLPTMVWFNHSHTEHSLSDASRRGVKARPLPPVILSFLLLYLSYFCFSA